MTTFIVLAHNSSQQVQVFGPFDNEEKAGRWARIHERRFPKLGWLVLEIMPKSTAEVTGAGKYLGGE